ncbi:uroporphyrinogen decarboxylase [Hoyosella rhizosphaerae]|uniref:Uroporphyrinogen decarboxylase n=1 Tax=Hoyosella rhizosphaerae TaxID=1755582 RepID=A0A916U5N8_9ACTN|nr:uroporphyrinogen decarboxylase [Hoyosella rhizosphaerae]MBN4926395.1 uroporphyrinogen decarboxylase [Hoyosella rhizosphaerae]GGC59728.1 uroporphyrinogen decarboxylase [Hoyosella rhizosphaerae]
MSDSSNRAHGYAVRRVLPDAPFLIAATGGPGRGEYPTHRPVWFMRQAGRSLPEYRDIRADIGMLESCFRPELVCEITMQPVRRHKVDAAILFSDIVVPLKAAGVDLDIVAGRGPVVANPVRSAADVAALPRLEEDEVGAVADAIKLLVSELGTTPLIGFAGAPFTLASYLVEGGPSRSHAFTKALMHSQPDVWNALLGKLTDIAITFLRTQINAGVDAVQLFDSWAGALSLAEYTKYVLPHSTRIFDEVAAAGVPRIHFGLGTGELLSAMNDAGPDVMGVDFRIPLDEAVRRIGPGKVVQGNLDPAILFSDWATIEREVRRIAREGDAAIAAGATGHIFNLGHGVLPETDPTVITRVVELIHTL